MDISSIGRKLWNGEWHYALGRFHWVRRAYSAINQRRHGRHVYEECAGTLFPRVAADEALEQLRESAVALGFDLPPTAVRDLTAYASAQPIERSGDKRLFSHGEVSSGRLADGSLAILGHVQEPEDAPWVDRICADPILRRVVSSYLGYAPQSTRVRLFWSYVTSATEQERMKLWQTVRYHFDVGGFNFVYANFYLTDADSRSGAHVLIRGSHIGKPLRMLFHSANQSDAAVLRHFGVDREFMIEGPAGMGFVEDSSCYHKALAPVERERLLLQIRFS